MARRGSLFVVQALRRGMPRLYVAILSVAYSDAGDDRPRGRLARPRSLHQEQKDRGWGEAL